VGADGGAAGEHQVGPAVVGREAQGEVACVAGETSGDGEQPQP